MHSDDLLILTGNDVLSILEGREREVISIIKAAYEAHGRNQTSLPHSCFLRFPDNQLNRVIALPAYIGDGIEAAGIKWVSSFPGNIEKGLDRASATVIVNSALTGRPEALIEGSIISARRTAASAVLAAQCLRDESGAKSLGIVGCGVINFEMVRFYMAAFPETETILVFDKDQERSIQFKERGQKHFREIEFSLADSLEAVLETCKVISIATTALQPHIEDLSMCKPGTTILHISLRDISPAVIIACDNVVDDADHVCRAQTSVHLAEQITNNRDFIRCSLPDILLEKSNARIDSDSIAIFSPFGLGILDLALSKFVIEQARERGAGTIIKSFLPQPWSDNHL
jgi:ornithine cyclodeaminase